MKLYHGSDVEIENIGFISDEAISSLKIIGKL